MHGGWVPMAHYLLIVATQGLETRRPGDGGRGRREEGNDLRTYDYHSYKS